MQKRLVKCKSCPLEVKEAKATKKKIDTHDLAVIGRDTHSSNGDMHSEPRIIHTMLLDQTVLQLLLHY